MKRSKRFVFVPFCLLCQGVRATGIVRHYPAVVEPVVSLLTKLNINIVQMPCPELIFDSFHRKPCQKPKYDNPQNRAVYAKLAKEVVDRMAELQQNGCSVEAILGIDFSPSCAVNLLTGKYPRRRVKGKGIFIEELERELHRLQVKPSMVGVELYQIKRTLKRLREVLERSKQLCLPADST
ncbi:MAG: DUF523 domain-containing protein [Parcubacteria group bacterium]|nr:DUF523 domain-containing protein [Parcubacteria group bacterium]